MIWRKNLFLSISAFILSVVYAVPYYWQQVEFSRIMLEGQNSKPYIVRVLAPLIARWFVALGARDDIAVILVIALSGIAFVFALRYLIQSLYQPKHLELIVLLGLSIFVILFENYRKIYDLSTAFFFTLGLALMVRHRILAYLIVFALATLNRETTILMTGVFVVYFYNKMERTSFLKTVLAQVLIFVVIQSAIRYLFSGVGGSNVWFAFEQNVIAYLDNPIRLIVDLGILALIGWTTLRQWNIKPVFLRASFLTLAPTLVVLYLVCGQAFEYRVFAEAFSATALMVIPRT